MITLPPRKYWAWWIAAAGATALVLGRRLHKLHRTPLSLESVAFPDLDASPQAAALTVRTDEELRSIFALARRLVVTNAAHTDTDREACLLRAAAMVLKSSEAAVPFVQMHRDAFLMTSREERAPTDPDCKRCGAPMQVGSSHDRELDEWMPVWTCTRCGAQVPR